MSISRTLCASLLALVQVLPAASYAQSDTERQKAHVVSRLYQATYGAEDRCKPSKLASLEFGKAFNQFSVAYPELIRLLKASPHLTTAKEQYAKFLAHPSTNVNENALFEECRGMGDMLRQFVEAPGAKEAMDDFVQTLKK